MGLLQKKPVIGTHVPLYSTGAHRTVAIVGLGNPGREYKDTRHNIGFSCLDSLAERLEFPHWNHKKDFKADVTTAIIGDARVILIKPTTFMNLSGESVQAIKQFYKLANDSIFVVHDELDVPFGQIRMRIGGSAAGHNGIKSIIDSIGEDFGRVRIGTQNDISQHTDSKDYVLGRFTKDEQAHLNTLKRETNAILSEIIHGQQLQSETRSFIV